MKTKKTVNKILWYLILTFVVFIFSLPFLWMFFGAFKTPQQSVQFPPRFLPEPWTLNGLKKGLATGVFNKYFLNTVFITVCSTFGCVVSASLVGFGFAKLRARGKNAIFFLLLSTMMIPGNVTLLPVYVLYSKLGWINTYLPLIIPAFLGGGAFFIFLMKQFFESIPKELDEAAKIDGCSRFRTFLQIYLPNSKPPMLVIALFSFVSSWNDFFGPMIFLTSPSKYTLAVGLKAFQTQYSSAMDTAPLMAVSLLSVIPIILLFVFAQKYFVQGIVTTGIK